MDAPAKVLVVDDEAVVLDSVTRHLSRDGKDHQVDLIGLDDAFEALGRLDGDGSPALADLGGIVVDDCLLARRVRRAVGLHRAADEGD